MSQQIVYFVFMYMDEWYDVWGLPVFFHMLGHIKAGLSAACHRCVKVHVCFLPQKTQCCCLSCTISWHNGTFCFRWAGFHLWCHVYVTTHSNNSVMSLLWSRNTAQYGPQCYRQCVWDCVLWHHQGPNRAVQPYEGFYTMPLHICCHCRYDNKLLFMTIQHSEMVNLSICIKSQAEMCMTWLLFLLVSQ